MSVKLLTEHNLEFLSLTGGCTGSSVCIHVKMPYCWKSHVTAHIFISRWTMCGESPLPVFTRNRWLSKEIFSNKLSVAKRGAQIYMCRAYNVSTCSSIFNILGLSKPILPPLSSKSVKCSVGITNHVDPVQTALSVVYTVCLVRLLLLGRIRF